MHHFHIVLIADGESLDHSLIEGIVEEMMAPYYEEKEVEPYLVEYTGDVAGLREWAAKYKGFPDASLEQLADYLEEYDGLEDGFVNEGKLFGYSTTNPDGKWDWYSIGGRWNGVLLDKPRSSEDGFNFDDEYRTLGENMLRVKWMDIEKSYCASILTPDGEWHDGHWDWYGVEPWHSYAMAERDSPELALWRAELDRREALWDEEAKQILRDHLDCIAVGVDFHS